MAKKPTASISSLTFSGGQKFILQPNEKIILVGPNNSGKSQSLREIIGIAQKGEKERSKVVKELILKKSGTTDELREFLESEAEYIRDNYRYKNWNIPYDQIIFWAQPYLTHSISAGYIKNIVAKDRLSICDQQNSISPGDQKTKPQHILYDDDILMEKISNLFKKAFGTGLMFDFRGGSKIPIHVGNKKKTKKVVDRVGDSHVKEVRSYPLLDEQGDGMKSYAGILFEAIVANLDITLIDEPEAFLHPPQMRRLGETLSSEVSGQLIVATHSSDIMRGFLEGTKGNVRILRIRREGDENIVKEASPKVIKELWEKPELRYSNALEGVFHEQTIICEDDSDCRLINSVADYLASNSSDQWQDTAYVPTGGKHGIPKVASVLRQIGVPVKAVFDIDFLSEQKLVESTVEAFGGDWIDIKQYWLRIDSAVRKGKKPKPNKEIKEEIVSIVQSAREEDLPKSDIIEAIKQGQPWHEIKKYGKAGIPKGNAQTDFECMRGKLEHLGIFIVPVGEFENFCPEIGLHGPKFVTKLLSTVPLHDEKLGELRAFVDRVHKGAHSSG